ncbi:MAG: ABC transporter permease [Anaerolineae bacterium]|jgi:ABC-type polysaccharide/polyol phosphate export permease|nr:ABC transporter permease [Anaerolineae bacterium]
MTQSKSSAAYARLYLNDAFTYGLVLLGGLLVAAQLRLKVTAGAALGDSYAAQPPILALLVVVGAVVSVVAQLFLQSRTGRWGRFWAGVVGTGVLAASLLILTPEFSQLQVAYFALASVGIGVIILRLTPNRYPLSDSLHLLWRNRGLLALWVRYNVVSRYSQTFLGILWIVMLPVATSLILAFVFSYIFTARDIGDAPFITFFLSGMMYWTLFMQGVTNGTVSIVSKLGLINQIYFPREILVLVKLGEALVDFAFIFVVTLVINALVGVYPNFNYIYLPVLLLIQLVLMLGLMMLVGYLTVLVRDIQQLTAVFIQMMFYLTPIMYPVDILTENLAELVMFLNPMAALVNAYRDVMVYNRAPDFVSLYFPIVLAVVLCYSGYMFFKANERKLADFR